MPIYIAVQGTHERSDTNWSSPDSAVSKFLEGFGIINAAKRAVLPYAWSANLNLSVGDDWDWQAGGRSLYYYCVPMFMPQARIPPEETVFITHSHGLQPALYAAKFGLKIDRLLDIAGPVRQDMMEVAKAATANIRQWVHIHSDNSDKWQWLGELFDGHFGIVRSHPLATENIGIPKVGHTGILKDPQYFHYWQDLDLIGFLRGEWKTTVSAETTHGQPNAAPQPGAAAGNSSHQDPHA